MPGFMDDEIKNLQLDRPGRGKSAEQMKKHTLHEHFDNKPIERALYLLTKGDEVQKISIIQQLPQLVQFDENATYTRILPKIQQELPSSSCEFQINASKIFQIFLNKPKAPPNLLTAVLQGIESRDLIVVNAWLETLIAVIPTLQEESIRKEILPIAVTKAGLTQPVMSRIATCSILGKVAIHPKFKPLDIKKDVLPIVQSLCQDVQPEVRAAICQQLPNVAQGLGEEFVKSHLLPCLVELASDNNPVVRSAAISSIVNMLKYMNAETKKSTIVPLVKKLFDKSVSIQDVTAGAVAKEIGVLIQGLLSCLSTNETTNFLNIYKTLARRGISTRTGDAKYGDPSMDVLCRDRCAYNLPAMLQITMNVVPDQLEQMYAIFRELAADPCYIVRRTVGGCVHEIARILGANNKIMKPDFVRLLRDDAEEVLQTLVPNLANTLELFCKHGVLSKEKADQGAMEIGRAMLKCQLELTKGYNWRLLSDYLAQLERLPQVVPSDFIHQHFTPVVLSNALNGRARPVRAQAVRTLLMFLRYNNKENQQKWLRDSLISELCYSNSCYTRKIYIILCSHALEIFPEKYFKDYFFIPLISLADDPVPNIKYMFINLLPHLNKILTGPQDGKLKQILSEALNKIERNEKDGDVVLNLKQKLKQSTNIAPAKMAPVQASYPRPEPVLPQRTPSKSTVTSIASRGGRGGGAASYGDMTFLEQHFYIDAGINLPELEGTNLNKEETEYFPDSVLTEQIDIEDLDETDLKALEIATTNITDDVKVNLRKLTKKSDERNIEIEDKSTTVNKRHSSVFSTNCLETRTRKHNNRRSLNIPIREQSKIPVSRSSKEITHTTSNKLKSNKNNEVSCNINKSANGKAPRPKSTIVDSSYKDVSKTASLVRQNSADSLCLENMSNVKENVLPTKINSKQQSNLPLFIG